GLKEKYEAAHGIRILDEGIIAAATLSSRYLAGRQLPDKAVDLLDTAAARVKIARATKPEAVDDIERRLQALEREKIALEGDASMGGVLAGNARDREQRLEGLAAEIVQLKEARDEVTARVAIERAALDKVLALRTRAEGVPATNGKEGAIAPDPTALP